MKISLVLFIHFLHGICCTENLKKYLDDNARTVDEKIRLSRSPENFHNVKLREVDSIKFIGNYSSGEIFTFFNKSYTMLDQEVYKVSRNNYSAVNTFDKKIRLLKTTEFQNFGFLLFSTNDSVLHVFGFSNDSFFKIQNIVHVNTTDATFFKNQKDLYLITASYKSPEFTTVVVYKFMHSHFDETEKFLTSGVTKLHTFDNKGSQIIVVLQKFGITSSLYEFKQDKIRKLHKVDTKSSSDVLSYSYLGRRYVIFFSVHHVYLHLWKGTDLLFLEEHESEFALTGAKDIFYNDDVPYLSIKLEANLLIFSLTHFFQIYNSALSVNWTDIWTYSIQNNELLALGRTELNTVEFKNFSISVKNASPEKIVEKEKLFSCFLNLEQSVYLLRNQITEVENQTSIFRESREDEFAMKKWEDLQTKFSTVKTVVEGNKKKILIINQPAVVDIPKGAKKITGEDIRFKSLNNQTWQPETWLSYENPQNITKAKIQNLKTVDLKTTEPLLNDLMLSRQNQIFSGYINVTNVTADRVETNFLNGIDVSDFYYKSRPVEIKGLKSFPSLVARNATVASINGLDAATIVTSLSAPILANNVTITDLWVDNINGVNFNELKESVFRINVDDSINGNLIFRNVEAEDMNFESLSKMSNVLTTSTDQTIRSSMKIPQILVGDVFTNTINGIDFKNLAATLDDKVIEGPVSMGTLEVENDLVLEGDIDEELLSLNDTHIIGTKESDFLQRYNGNVTIKGNLILNNFNLAESAKIVIDGKKFDREMNQFWTKSTTQSINTHFEAQKGISTTHLYTTSINGIKVEDYMLNSTEQPKSGRFYFESAIVNGSIFLDSFQQHSPDLAKIQQEAVKTEGVFTIKGKKTYTNTLKVDNLKVGRLDNVDSSPKNIVIVGNLTVEKLSVKKINDIDIQNLAENTVYIDRDQRVSNLNFQNLTAQNMFTTTLNNKNMTRLLSDLRNIHETKTINDVFINNNVSINNVGNLSSINDQNVAQLLQNSRKLHYNDTIQVPTKFLGNIKIRDLHILTVNNVNLQTLSKRILYKSWNQPINAMYIFKKITSTNLITEKINDVNLKDLIDVTKTHPQIIRAPGGIKFSNHVNIQNLFGNFGCSLNESLQNLRSPLTQFWDTVTISGNVTFWDKESLMSRIFDEVVTLEKSNVVVKGNVHFAEHTSVNNITALKKINRIDIMEIIEDAFLNRPNTEQTVTGKKTFIHLEAETLLNLQNTNVSAINDINIAEIDYKIISKNAIPDVPIRGKKLLFGGLQTKKIQTDSISGVKVENLVTFKDAKTVPNAMFESISVIDNFNITFVNGMPLEVFLNERLLRKAPTQELTGRYFFREIAIKGNITTPHINDIKIENIVFDIGTQTINAPKNFTKDLKIFGNITAHVINGLEVSKSYEMSVLKNEETNFTGSVQIMKPVIMHGGIQTNYINSIPIEYILDTSAKFSVQIEAKQIHEITKILTGFIKKYMNITRGMPTEILYLEKSKDLQIPLSNSVSAQIVETKDVILIHVESEENGDVCGLDPTCKCPMQQTMEISPQNQITPFMNKAMQRIYSYYNDDITIHVTTHSVSSSSECRANKRQASSEGANLVWNVQPKNNRTGGFFNHKSVFSGFISSVEFFTIYGRTYIVIGTYYDPVLNTHDVDALVLRFTEDKTAIEEIQRIPTKGMKIISLFPTAQGYILVMGHEMSQFNHTTTQIMRFHPKKQQFFVLREVAMFGTAYSQGVVLGRDSLIILANKHSNLLVLKYQEEFDNYYLYQTFQLNNPVASMSVFYSEGFGISDAYLTVVTTNHEYFIYSFRFIEGWKLEFSGKLEDTNILVPFKLKGQPYLFAPSSKSSSLLMLVKHDSN